jgi:hypothetical protein
MHAMMDLRLSRQRHEEMPREAELDHLKKTLRANRRRSASSRWASTVAWELARTAALFRKLFRTPKNHDQN